MALPAEMNCITSTVIDGGKTLEFAVVKKPTPKIEKPRDIVVRVEAAPINPADLGVIFGAADRGVAKQEPGRILAPIPEARRAEMEKTPYGESRAVPVIPGNEGGGVVVAAGSDLEAQRLLGKTVGVFGGSAYAQYIRVGAGSNRMMELPDGVTSHQAASCFVNPLTVLGQLCTMRDEGHQGLIHTAAASNLGQIMVKVCQIDNIPLVNVVRRPEQADLLRSINKDAIVVNQSSPSFMDDLVQAINKANATICYDATGGGSLSSQILAAMEKAGKLSTDGRKQMYHYGGLDTSPSTLTPEQQKKNCDFWALPMWQPTHKEQAAANRARVSKEITSTFTSMYIAEVGLDQTVSLDALKIYGKFETGKKYLINPQKTANASL